MAILVGEIFARLFQSPQILAKNFHLKGKVEQVVTAAHLAEKIRANNTQVWLVNTGWSGGPYGVGKRIPLKATRAIVDAINNNTLSDIATTEDKLFGFNVPKECPGVPTELLQPRNTWKSGAEYDQKAQHLAELFKKNFAKFEKGCSEEIKKAGPRS